MPLLLVYWICFYWIYKKGETFSHINQYSMTEKSFVDDDSYNSGIEVKESEGKRVKVKDEEKGNENKAKEEISVTGNAIFSIALIKSVWKNIWFWGVNLGLVYFLEYSITTGFSDRATLKYSKKASFVKENSYVIIQFCYQFGVLFSRSSLKVFKVNKVWIVTVLQLINWVVWWIEAEVLFLTEWGEFVLTVWVGCMGGLAYVNTGYLILNSEVIPKEHKEASINMSLCINTLGILVAASFCLILDNFIITN